MSRAVLVTKQVPWPSDSGGRLRSARVAELFTELYDEVHVVAFGEATSSSPESCTVHAFPGPGRSDLVRGVGRTRSAALARWSSSAMALRVRDLLTPETHLHVDFSQMAVLAPGVDRIDSIDLHNVESDLLRQRATTYPKRLLRPLLRREATRVAAWETRLAGVPLMSCVSEPDRMRLSALGLDPFVVPNGADLPADVGDPENSDLVLFVGALDWEPNIIGLEWFAAQVWPLVTARRPSARCEWVGRAPSPRLASAAGRAGIRLVGPVASTDASYRAAAITTCPLLTGGGSRLKILESLAHGRAVVSTTLGAEGLEALVGQGVLLADTPDEMAARTVELLERPDEALTLGRRGRRAVTAWSWPETLRPLRDRLTRSRR